MNWKSQLKYRKQIRKKGSIFRMPFGFADFGRADCGGVYVCGEFQDIEYACKTNENLGIILPEAFLIAFFSFRFNIGLGIFYSLNTYVTFFISFIDW